jgi:hypothetical protein
MAPKDNKTNEGIEKALDHEERSDRSLPCIDRREVLKFVLASAPVIITFTAGVAKADAAGYNYDSGPAPATTAVEEPTGGSVDWSYKGSPSSDKQDSRRR